jgi:pectin methylesterase-like acyl-CoA thioesterase
MKKNLFSVILTTCFFIAANAQNDLTVAQDGTGNHTTVQAAINAAPTGRTTPYKIYVKKGKYLEKISIPSNKPFIYLIGENVGTVTLSWDDYSGKAMPGGGTYGTSNSASVTFNAADCGAVNITFENTTGDAPQALAINVNATRCVFKNCRFLGGQDTVLTNGNGNFQYFRNCYIDGVVDFIFGAAVSVFDSCIVYAKTRVDGLSGSYITAANTPAGQTYGYVFRDCVIPANRGTTSYVMGRPWQNDGTTSPASNTKVVFINTTMSSSIKPQGWDVWNSNTVTSLITYAEYRSRKFDSTLVDVSQRVAWSQQLTAAQAVGYTNAAIFGSWDPCATIAEICAYTAKPLITSNFKGVKGAVNSTFTWNISWPISNVKYEIFRSNDRLNFTKVAEQTSSNDTTVNYNYSEAIPPPSSTYYYYVWSTKAGLTNHSSDTIAISSTPTITATGSLGSFLQGLGAPSSAQTYSVSGINLTAPISITAPTGYEISSNGGTSWNNSSTPISLTQDVNGNIASTSISVRLNATIIGNYNDSIIHTSTGANTVKTGVTGTVQSAPVVNQVTLLQWPMTANNLDDAAARNSAVTASSPTLTRMALSNGTTVSAVPSYSTIYGQAFGASSNGDGTWTTATGGPGGNLNRAVYEQFTVTAATGSTARVDSFIVTSSFYNTSSNTKLAVVYSTTGFATDSSNVNGGIGADGLSMPGTANGAFTTPILLTNETAGTTTTYRFSLTGGTGITLTSGQTLTIRLYFSCGSGSAGRYAKVKNVIVKGVGNSTVPVTILSFNAANETNQVKLAWTTSNEINTSHFTIEKSNDGTTFNQLGQVNTGSNNYNFIDASPVKNINYYRLKIVDKDGSFTYSKTITINNKLKGSINIYPNPATNDLTVTHLAAKPNSTITITGVDGKQLLSQKLVSGTTQSNIDISKLNNGVYILTINNSDINTIKFIKN